MTGVAGRISEKKELWFRKKSFRNLTKIISYEEVFTKSGRKQLLGSFKLNGSLEILQNSKTLEFVSAQDRH